MTLVMHVILDSSLTSRVDSRWDQEQQKGVKRWFTLLLVIGALLGLMGQEAAFAQVMSPPKTTQSVAIAQMSPECAEMMGLVKQPQSDQPCQGMTPDCIAKMGCAVPLALLPSVTVSAAPELLAIAPAHRPVAPLFGRDAGPEPEPPVRLG